MSRSNPSVWIRELTKPIEERVEIEMEKVMRERESLKRELHLLEKTQKSTILDKSNLEEKLKSSERKCKEIEQENEELRRKNVGADEAIEAYKNKVDCLESKMLGLKKYVEFFYLHINSNEDKEKGTDRVKEKEETEGEEEEPEEENMSSSDFDESAGKDGDTMSPQRPSGELPKKAARFSVMISRRCDLEIINKIKSHLDQENWEKICEKSCFRHLMKMNDFKFQGQLMLHLVQHLDTDASCIKESELAFRIGNSIKVFRATDFGRITGLDVGRSEEVTKTSSSIHEDVLKGRPKIALAYIKKALLQVSGGSEVALKLALLYFLYGILMPGNDTIEPNEMRYLHLVDDLDEFNAFPWGRVAYQFLVKSILIFKNSLRPYNRPIQGKLYKIHGFACALQAWVYEAMPDVAAYCATNVGNLTPRILCWSATKKIHYDHLNKFFTSGIDKPHLYWGCKKSKSRTRRISQLRDVGKMKSDQNSVECGLSKNGTSGGPMDCSEPAVVGDQLGINVVKKHEITRGGETETKDSSAPAAVVAEQDNALIIKNEVEKMKLDQNYVECGGSSSKKGSRGEPPAGAVVVTISNSDDEIQGSQGTNKRNIRDDDLSHVDSKKRIKTAIADCDSKKPLLEVERNNAADVDSDDSCSDENIAKLVAEILSESTQDL